jgi:hypothetical protein
VPIFVALGPAAIMAGTNVAGGWLYLSCGQVHRQTRWVFIASLFLLAPVVYTLQYGVLAVAIAVSVSRVLIQLPSVSYACHGTPVRLRDYIEATFFVVTVPFAAACCVGLFFALLGCRFWGLQPSLSRLWEANLLPFWGAINVILFKVSLTLGMLLVVAIVWPAARKSYLATFSELQRFRRMKRRPNEALSTTNEEIADEV